MTRRQNSAEVEAPQSTETVAAPAIPPGVQADVNIKYKTQVDPNHSGARERDELADLADLADTMQEPPLDEVSEYCYVWAKYAGQPLSVIRLPDPPERRIPGKGYARPCFTLERLGTTTFDPNSLIDTLRFINNNSGGVFRIWLNYNGVAIPESRLEPIAIGDPVGSHLTDTTVDRRPSTVDMQWRQPPPPLPQKSASEIELERAKETLFTTALQRALNPPAAVAPTGAPGSNLPAEDQATLFLLSKTDFLGSIFTKLSDLAQQSANVAREPSWKDRAIDAGLELATKNPAIVDRLSGVVERIIARVLPDPRFDGPPTQQGYIQQPQPQPQQTVDGRRSTVGVSVDGQRSTVNGRRFTPDPGPPDAPVDDDEDEETMDILDSLVELLNSDRELTLSDPVLINLSKRYPVKFGFAVKMIIRSPLDGILDWIKITGGPAYISMLEGHSGPYLIERMTRLQTLIIEANNKANAQKETTTSAPETGKTNA